jgi:hypothetical protein
MAVSFPFRLGTYVVTALAAVAAYEATASETVGLIAMIGVLLLSVEVVIRLSPTDVEAIADRAEPATPLWMRVASSVLMLAVFSVLSDQASLISVPDFPRRSASLRSADPSR